ncbi:hypothetical protein [Neptunicella sp. SCSIO 80796]|uniref:hypothetical protein n=1 Tax=Neptunicella plasticusilytica TaxID=3117012 RepID=UPI003A4E53D0
MDYTQNQFLELELDMTDILELYVFVTVQLSKLEDARFKNLLLDVRQQIKEQYPTFFAPENSTSI